MDRSTHYVTGEEIHVGDEVLYDEVPARVHFVIGRGEFAGGFAEQKEWFREEYGKGVMIESESMGFLMFDEADEDLEFVRRGVLS